MYLKRYRRLADQNVTMMKASTKPMASHPHSGRVKSAMPAAASAARIVRAWNVAHLRVNLTLRFTRAA